MAIDLLATATEQATDPPDTGSFPGDVLVLTKQLADLFLDPLAGRVIAALAAEAGHDHELE